MVDMRRKWFCRMSRVVGVSALWMMGVLMTGLPVAAQMNFGDARLFNLGWKFSLSDDPEYKGLDYDDSSWRELTLPHDWSIESAPSPDLASCTGWFPGGIGWYRKDFEIADTTRMHHIYFEGIYNRSEVYLNGHLLGKRPNGYVSFGYDMTPYLRQGRNTLAVRVDHSRSADSRWYTGSGIYRDVYLIETGRTHISPWGVGFAAKNISNESADAEVSVAIDNPIDGLRVLTELKDADGEVVAESEDAASSSNLITLKVSNPKLWSVKDPALYNLEITLLKDNEPLDRSVTPVGIREIRFDADKGFFLNGENMKIKGVCLHHDGGVLGAVVPERIWERRLKTLKDMGVNAVRMSHNPQAPIVYDLCDRLGLMVMDEASDEWEFPKRKWLKGWNKGTPGFEGSYDFFEEWIERDVTDMVRRDRNHPSVILWSIGNEVDYPNDPYSHPILDGTDITQPMYGGYDPKAPDAMRIGEIAKRLAACVRSVDTSRPVTGALAGVVMSNQTAYPEAVDVVGYNYTEKRYKEDHEAYPDRVIYGSETRQDYPAWRAVADNDFISGQFLWTGSDYLGESGAWPSRGLGTGLLDFAGDLKPNGYFRASLWSETPVTYIGTYPKRGGRLSMYATDNWDYKQGMMIRVVCFTNSPAAALYLNGRQVGEMREKNPENGMIYWDIPYYAGILEAVGYDETGKRESSYSIATPGEAVAISARSDKEELRKEGDIAIIEIEVQDENGNRVKRYDGEIGCEVSGGGSLLGLETGNNRDMSDPKAASRKAYRGKLVAYVRADGSGEPIEIKVSAPKLKETKITL